MPVATSKERLSHTPHYLTAVGDYASRNTHSTVKVEMSTAQKETSYCEVCYIVRYVILWGMLYSRFEYFTLFDYVFLKPKHVAINYIIARY